MTPNITSNPITEFVSNLLKQEDRWCRMKWQHGSDCPGIEIHGYRLSPTEHDFEECAAIACDSLEADAWVKIGESSSGSLCGEHLLTWLEHEVEITCEGCKTMFQGNEGLE